MPRLPLLCAVALLLVGGAPRPAAAAAGVSNRQLALFWQLHRGAFQGNATAIAEALAGGAPVDAVDQQAGQGHTPLMLAAMAGQPAAVRALLAAGAHVTRANDAGKTARELVGAAAAAVGAAAAAQTARTAGHDAVAELLQAAEEEAAAARGGGGGGGGGSAARAAAAARQAATDLAMSVVKCDVGQVNRTHTDPSCGFLK